MLEPDQCQGNVFSDQQSFFFYKFVPLKNAEFLEWTSRAYKMPEGYRSLVQRPVGC